MFIGLQDHSITNQISEALIFREFAITAMEVPGAHVIRAYIDHE
jgi:hypothetical protein